MGIHEAKGKSDEWYTPKYIFDAMETEFDLDVSSPKQKTFVPAQEFITEGSLEKEWNGFVWMNPPFANMKQKFQWINKFIEHKNGIALFPDRTSCPWWQYFAKNCDAVLFVDGKIKFYKPDGSIGDSPSNGTTLFAIGEKAIKALKTAKNNELGIYFETN